MKSTTWTDELVQLNLFFRERAKIESIFAGVRALNDNPTLDLAKSSARHWYQFSHLMPLVLSYLATTVEDNVVRHYIVLSANEELGEGDPKKIHSDLFREDLRKVNLWEEAFEEPVAVVQELKRELFQINTQAEALGFSLGLELPAEENIQVLFRSLLAETSNECLQHSPFFSLHFQNEPEHIRRALNNYLLFCKEDHDRRAFVQGFDKAISFWNRYWAQVARGRSLAAA